MTQEQKRIKELEELVEQKDKVIKLLLSNTESQKQTNLALVKRVSDNTNTYIELIDEGQSKLFNIKDGGLKIPHENLRYCNCETCETQRRFNFYSTSTLIS
jgi:hypothetical protein